MKNVGTPGGSLQALTDRGGKRRVQAGRRGENDTRRLLTRMFRSEEDVWAFHDLRMPGRKGRQGESANIDHVLFRGKRVVVLDSKRWEPGFYFTLAGRSFRAPFKRAVWCDKATVEMAIDRLRRALPPDAVVSGAILVHPAGVGSIYLRCLRPSGGGVIFPASSIRAERWLRKELGERTPPDGDIGRALRRLVHEAG